VGVTFAGADQASLAAKGLSELDINGSKISAMLAGRGPGGPGGTGGPVGPGGPLSPGEGGPKGRGRGRGIDFPLRVLVSSDMVGAIIGRGGATIRNITQQSRARVDVHRKLEHSASLEKAITVYGQPENCTAACKRILEVMEEEARNVGKPPEIALKILAHNNLIGRIIGKQGGTIKKIMEDTDTKITVSSISDISCFNPERVITIKGSIPNISQAEAEVSSKLRAAYETDLNAMTPHSMMFPGLHPTAMMSTVGISSNYRPGPAPPTGPVGPGAPGAPAGPGAGFVPGGPPGGQAGAGRGLAGAGVSQETTYLYIPNSAVGAIIGTKGSHIRNIIKFSGSSVKISSAEEGEEGEEAEGEEAAAAGGGGETQSPGAAAAGGLAAGENLAGQRRVTILGAPEAQWKAQYLIFQKLREEGFAPGNEDIRLTVEILVPSSQVGRIIGKGGQNVREMQRLTGAVIKLPEQGTSTGEETSVHIVGSFYSIQSAQRRIRSLVASPVVTGGGGGGGGPQSLHNGGGAPPQPPQIQI